MNDVDNHYQKTQKKWESDLKSLKKQNKILSSMAKRSVSRRELKNIKNIKAKASNNNIFSRNNSSSIDSDTYYSLSLVTVSETK